MLKKRIIDYSKRESNPFYIELGQQTCSDDYILNIIFKCPSQLNKQWEGFCLMGESLKILAKELQASLKKEPK